MTPANATQRTRPTVALFILLFLIGCTYLGSLGYFLAKDQNFVHVQKIARATAFARSTQLSLPATLTFDVSSKWHHALSIGWNFPNSGAIWAANAHAQLVLPALADPPSSGVCITVDLDTMAAFHHWPMLITVNGQALVPRRVFTGPGPIQIQGTVPIAAGSLVQVDFGGPRPKVPNLISDQTRDSRYLAYRLREMKLTAKCAPGN